MMLRIFIPALLTTLVGAGVYTYWFSDWFAQKEAVLTLPPGFKVTVFADNVGAARHIVVAPNGNVYVAVWDSDDQRGGVFGARNGNDAGSDNKRGGVLALRDTNGDGRADVQEQFGEEGGSGIALRGNSLFFATWTTVYRYELEPEKLVPAKPPEIVGGGFPRSGHSARSLSVDENGSLFVNIAAPTNWCQKVDTERESPGKDPCPELEQFGGIWRFDANRKNQKQPDGERYATGLRNIVALALNSADKALYGVQHGRDHLIESFPKLFNEKQAAENAAEEFFRIERGGDYGHPYCYYDFANKKKVLAPEYGGNGTTVGRCAEKKQPLVAFRAHWAPISLLFYTGNQFPARYTQGAFVAFHGSWFRVPLAQEGFNVVFVPFQNGQPTENYEVFADDFAGARKHPRGANHRPTGLAQASDGALYISDDKGGRIWRITYNAPTTNDTKIKTMNNMRKNLSFLKLLLASMILALPFASNCEAQQKTDFKELETIAAQELKETNTPGAAVVIVSGDRIVFAKGFGVSNIETGQPVTTDMLFRIGSLTKPFTAATLLSLSEEGKIKLDAPVGNYVKGLIPGFGQMTLHQLLSHTAGIQDGARPFGLHDEKEMANAVRSWKDDLLFTSPGKIFSYSNLGFGIVGVTIEEVGGKPFADQLDERLFKPLGMSRTTFRPTVAMTYPLAQGHQARGGGRPSIVRSFTDNAADWAAGFMFSSADDIARFAVAFMNEGKIDGKQILPAAVIRKMSAPYADVPGFEIKYGYGMRIQDYRGIHVIEHGGAIAGFGAELKMVPEHRFAVVVLGNKSGARLEKTVEKAMEMILPLKAKAASSTPKPIAMSAAEITNYVGNYVHSARANFEIVAQNGKLFWKRRDEMFPLIKTGNLRFMIPSTDPNELEEFLLVTRGDSKVEYLHMDGRAYKKQ